MFALAVIVSVTGCNKDKGEKVNFASKIVGEWHCTPASFDAEVYVSFGETGNFDLYQRIGEGRARHYTGTWWMKGSTLSGNYSDGTPWGDDYTVAVVDDNTVTLTTLNGSEETMTYTRESIPANIIEESLDLRSTLPDELPFL